MLRTLYFALIFSCLTVLNAQDEVRLPADLRQHNLTINNSSLFNPVFSLDRNDPQSFAVWTRWQWQTIDADPSTLYLNYTRRFNEGSTVGAAFFQHNTGIFFNTGGVLNYAHLFQFSHSVKLSVGLNLFGFVQKLADTRFQIDPQLPVPLPGTTNDFILQLAPGASLSVERLTLSLASENMLDYNFRAKEANTPASDKIFMGMMSYDFPVNLGSNKAQLRPSFYMRTIPEQENQIGILSLLRTEKYWGQLGYNNFYGVGVGAGGTFFQRFNLGAVFEFGTSASINSKDPSFELVASYFLGNPDERSVIAMYEDEPLEEDLASQEQEDEEKIKEELKKAEEQTNEVEPTEEEPAEQDVEEVEEPEEEQPVTEEISKKEQRKADKEAAAEEKRLAKEKEKQAKEEQAQIERELKEAKAKREEEAKQEALEEKKKEELRMAEEQAEAEIVAVQRRKDSVAEVQKGEEIAKQAATKRRLDSISAARRSKAAQDAAQKVVEERRLDSISEARKARADSEELQRKQDSVAQTKALAEELQRKQDSIAEAKAAEEAAEVVKEEVQPEEGEKYEEVTTEDGLEPGFYLIANVFGTKKYFDAFMADLTQRGLAPKSFLRSLNNYNYVYLRRYDTMSEARRARDSQFNGSYRDKTWVFRVVGE